jgi:hypothetical protein
MCFVWLIPQSSVPEHEGAQVGSYLFTLGLKIMSWHDAIDSLDKLARIAAVVVAGLWVYFNSLSGRTFVPRLQVDLSGKLFEKEGAQYLLVKMQVKNVGASIVQITDVGTCLKVTPLRRDADSIREGFIRETTQFFSVLKRYTVGKRQCYEMVISSIEPGTAIKEQKLLDVRADRYDHLELELRVVALPRKWWIFGKLLPKRWFRSRSFSAVALPVTDDGSQERSKVDQFSEEERA